MGQPVIQMILHNVCVRDYYGGNDGRQYTFIGHGQRALNFR